MTARPRRVLPTQAVPLNPSVQPLIYRASLALSGTQGFEHDNAARRLAEFQAALNRAQRPAIAGRAGRGEQDTTLSTHPGRIRPTVKGQNRGTARRGRIAFQSGSAATATISIMMSAWASAATPITSEGGGLL
ncbi:hypothetical protein ACVWWD_001601 [Mesorhizobium sp. URHB0026]